MPEVKPQSVGWTRVEDGLPKLSGRYLITEEFAYMRIVNINTYLSEYVAGCFADRKKYSGAGFYENTSEGHHEKNEFVIAWAELPDAYMEDWNGLDEKFV